MMKAHLRHVHELEPGTRFRLPMTERLGTVVDVTPRRCRATLGDTQGTDVEFMAQGERVEFTRPPASNIRPVPPTMQVEPITRRGN